ncbi:MAG: LysR substrate-binding domain-containing protein [Paracoccaceae bacterium]|nr:LysR substrate-binding domain-containing protein [Paracoccaceae bacterium]
MDQSNLRQGFLTGMSCAACTVNIVTTDGPAGRAGVTVSAMSSVSADTPQPTLLVCVHHLSPAADLILENGVFCVNVLRDDQGYISDTFAGRFKDQVGDKFECTDWVNMSTGSPRVADPLVGFDCRVKSSEKVGTHYVFIGEVEDLYVRENGSPLIYANRAYGSATPIESASSIKAGQNAAGSKLTVGCFHTFGPYILPEMISRVATENADISIELIEGDQRRIQESLLSGEAEVGLLYDLDLSSELETISLTNLQPYVLLAEHHPLAEKTELSPSDLVDHPMILLNTPPSRDYFLSILAEAGVTPNVAYKSTSFEMVRGMVGHGLGYSLLATKPASAMTYDGKSLVRRPLATNIAPSHVTVAFKKGHKLSKPAEKFLWLCRDFFALDA